MTVDARLQLTPGEYLIHSDGSASKVVDRRNMTVDEILASGRYLDRRGRGWHHDGLIDSWVERPTASSLSAGIVTMGYVIDEDQMRLLIVRDKHRVECKGLLGCRTHPVPVVTIQYNEDGLIIYETDYTRRTYPTLPEAMDAARALAVGE